MIKIAEKTDFKYYMKNGGGIFLNLNGVLQLKEWLCINSYKRLEELNMVVSKQDVFWYKESIANHNFTRS